MGIEMKTFSGSINESATVSFSADVLSFCVGVADWSFSFGSDDHHILEMALDLQSNSSGKEVTVKTNATLKDDSGNHISDGSSSITLVCIAVTGNADSNVALTNQNNIENGSQSAAIPLPGGGNTNITSSFVSGFELAYPNDDHHLEKMSISTGTSTAGTSGYITGAASMADDSGHYASTAKVSGAFVAQAAGSSVMIAKQKTNQQTGSPVSLDMGQTVKSAVAVLNSMSVSFGDDDHHLKTISGGVGKLSISGSKVSVASAEATLKDDSGNKQNNSDSHVSFTVFALT